MPSSYNLLPLLLLLIVWVSFLQLQPRLPSLRRKQLWILLALVPLALITHLHFFKVPFSLPRHAWDFYHYFVGPKYFAELGHAGLYEAQTVADYEDDPETYHPQVWVRVLDDYTVTHKAIIVAKREEIVARFTPDRWREFKSDTGAFRHRFFEQRKIPGWAQDHGYNGSPLTTAINGLLAQHSFLSVGKFVEIVSWFDLASVLGAAVLIGRALGVQWGLMFVFVFCVNPLNTFSSIGWSYLRYLYFVAMALGITAFLRGKNATSGILFAVATHLRLFPLLLPMAVLISDLIRPERWELLRSRRRFYVSVAATGALLFVATSFVQAPNGEYVWLSFAKNTAVHSQRDAINQISLRYPFRYSDEVNNDVVQRSNNRLDWIAETRKTFERNANWFYLTAAAFFALSLLYLRRLRHSEEAMFAGLAWLFIGSQVAVYDYVTLTLVPLLFWRDEFVWKWLGISWIVVCLFSYVLGSAASLDWGYRWINVILAVYFAGMLAWFAFARERAPSGV